MGGSLSYQQNHGGVKNESQSWNDRFVDKSKYENQYKSTKVGGKTGLQPSADDNLQLVSEPAIFDSHTYLSHSAGSCDWPDEPDLMKSPVLPQLGVACDESIYTMSGEAACVTVYVMEMEEQRRGIARLRHQVSAGNELHRSLQGPINHGMSR